MSYLCPAISDFSSREGWLVLPCMFASPWTWLGQRWNTFKSWLGLGTHSFLTNGPNSQGSCAHCEPTSERFHAVQYISQSLLPGDSLHHNAGLCSWQNNRVEGFSFRKEQKHLTFTLFLLLLLYVCFSLANSLMTSTVFLYSLLYSSELGPSE